jgi:hypothetical protein
MLPTVISREIEEGMMSFLRSTHFKESKPRISESVGKFHRGYSSTRRSGRISWLTYLKV